MILLDGQPSDSSLLEDRGLAYGDGLFETIALRDGQLLSWAAHLARLDRGCAVLGLPVPDQAQLLHEVNQVAAGRSRGIVKVLLTRGTGGRGYRPPASAQCRRIVSAHAWPADLNDDRYGPIATWICRQRLGHNPQLAGIKHLNRLEQVLASAEWPAAEYFEGLMLDFDDRLIEGIRSNVFVVHGRQLLTPDLARTGIAGIVRQAVIDTAPSLGLMVQVGTLDLASLATADELFLSNSVMGLRVVDRVDHAGDSLNLVNKGVAAALTSHLRAANIIP
jgi:4-amino-4-deoxychorismate lyase